MDSVTEVNLDDLDSGLSSVSIEKTEESFNDLSQQNSTDGIEDLDLLVDPNKSRSPVPPQRNDMDNEPLANLPTGTSSPPSIVEKKLDDDLDFQIKVERPPERPTPSFMPSSTFTPVPNRVTINDGVERQEMLFKLKRLESRGIPLSKHYSASSSLEEKKEEYSSLKNQRDVENSIKFQRKTMLAFASGVEFLNSKYFEVPKTYGEVADMYSERFGGNQYSQSTDSPFIDEEVLTVFATEDLTQKTVDTTIQYTNEAYSLLMGKDYYGKSQAKAIYLMITGADLEAGKKTNSEYCKHLKQKEYPSAEWCNFCLLYTSDAADE